MNPEQYKHKLIAFNSTDKYLAELEFLNRLLNIKFGETILDYGCGIGTAVRYIRQHSIAHVYGYDVADYSAGQHWFVKYPIHVTKAYFMHSIAHIQYVENALKDLDVRDEIIVITPNKDWLEMKGNEGYIPDTTVFRHYNLSMLITLFEMCGYRITHSGQFGESIEGVCERIFLIAKP